MKNILYLLVIISFISCSSEPIEKPWGGEAPDDYTFYQRSYPTGKINQGILAKARSQYVADKQISRDDREWVNKGPNNTGGRITDIARHPSDPGIFYVGTSVGGVFRTTDNGISWEAIFDETGVLSIGNIAIAKSNPDIIYVGTGEASGSASSGAFFGNGMYKSTDAGDSWVNIGLEESGHIGRIVVDRDNENLVYVAANGTLYGNNNERGLYKTANGGENWDRIHYISDSTACIDVAIHPDKPDVIFAAFWERQRFAWVRDYGGLTSGLHKSIDGGETWELMSNGLPEPSEDMGRIGITIAQSDPDVILASFTNDRITNRFEGLYQTKNGGDSWDRLDPKNSLLNVYSSFGWFFGQVRIDPVDTDKMFILGVPSYTSTDGGNVWLPSFGMHVDHHALEFFDQDNLDILQGNDGGLYRSLDGGETFVKYTNLPITMFYNIENDHQFPERLYGGTQDNNTIRSFSGSPDDYQPLIGGDGFHVIVDPVDNAFIYAESQWGNLQRSTNGGFSFNNATIGIDENDRTNWNTPVVMSPVDHNILFYGSNKLYTSFQASVWEPISEDLTKGQHPSGSQSYGNITTIGASYQNLDVIYVGTDDGLLWRTDNGGADWNLINNGLPNRYVTTIAVDPLDDQKAIVTYSGYRDLDYLSHIFITENGGLDWEDISSNLPEVPINDVAYDPDYPGTLYVGTDVGAWFTENNGGEWEVLGANLPPTIVMDVKLHVPTRTLIAGTFGRSMYTIQLQEVSSVESDLAVLQPMKLSPNPASDFVNIETEVDWSILEIYDMLGKKVHRVGKQNEINVASVPKGMYVVQLLGDSNELLATSKLEIIR